MSPLFFYAPTFFRHVLLPCFCFFAGLVSPLFFFRRSVFAGFVFAFFGCCLPVSFRRSFFAVFFAVLFCRLFVVDCLFLFLRRSRFAGFFSPFFAFLSPVVFASFCSTSCSSPGCFRLSSKP